MQGKDSSRPAIKVAASILSCDFTRLGEQVEKLAVAGMDWLHVDIMDGSFVDQISIGFPVLRSLRKRFAGLFLDVHCMITNPEKHLEALVESGADSITFHMEALSCPEEEIPRLSKRVRELGARSAFALSPETPVEKWLLRTVEKCELDMVLIMTVKPGKGGQSFMEVPLEKVSALREAAPGLDIEVDGGIKLGTIGVAAQAGANIFVSGTGILGAAEEDWKERVAALRARAEEARDSINDKVLN